MLGIIYTDDIYDIGTDILLAITNAGEIEKMRQLGSRIIVKYTNGWQWFISKSASTVKYDKYVVDDGATLSSQLLKSLRGKDNVFHVKRGKK